jgi:hypothetical protein
MRLKFILLGTVLMFINAFNTTNAQMIFEDDGKDYFFYDNPFTPEYRFFEITPDMIGQGGDPDVPIDGGISALLIAGAAYGARRLKKNERHKKDHS